MNVVYDFGLIIVMAAVSYATRIIGFVAADRFGQSSSLVRWMDRLGNFVLVLILARILAVAPPVVWAGVAVAVAAKVVTSRFFLSMWLGVAVVAAGRLIG